MGSITKRNSKDGKSHSYRLRVFVGRDEVTGKQIFRTETCTGSERQAKARLRELETQLEQGLLTEPNKMSLNAFVQKWLDEAAAHNRKRRTVEDLHDLFSRYVKNSALGPILLQKITPLHLQEWVNDLAKRLNPQTVKNAMSVLKGAFKAAVRWRFIVHNPTRDVDLPSISKGQEKVIRALTDEQIWTLLKILETDTRGAIFTFALETGTRPAEYIAVKWSDLDWQTGRIRIERTIMRPKGGGWAWDTPKTKKSRRTIPLSQHLLGLLREHRTRQLEARLLAGPKWVEHDLIFPNMYGNPANAIWLSQNFQKLVKKAQLPGRVRLYDLRHSMGTQLIASGLSAAIVAERMGHSTVKLTLDTYTSVLPTMQQEATDRITSIMYAKRGR